MLKNTCRLAALVCVLMASFVVHLDAENLTHVLIISIDALHPEALSAETTPHIHRVMAGGAHTLHGRSTNPPKTLIAHTAMVTGRSPEVNGKTDNAWRPGDPTVSGATLFSDAKAKGFTTGFFYSKQKMGYLTSPAVDVHRFSADFAADEAGAFLQKDGHRYAFVHISGLDRAGTEFGWLSPEYLEELNLMDEYLEPLISQAIDRPGYLLIITSDHAGHGRVHGSRHPEDFRLPFIIQTDAGDVSVFRNAQYEVTDLRRIVNSILITPRLPAP